MPALLVSTSLVTKRAGIDARFVNLVTKRAVVTKRAATARSGYPSLKPMGYSSRVINILCFTSGLAYHLCGACPLLIPKDK